MTTPDENATRSLTEVREALELTAYALDVMRKAEQFPHNVREQLGCVHRDVVQAIGGMARAELLCGGVELPAVLRTGSEP